MKCLIVRKDYTPYAIPKYIQKECLNIMRK